jgi:hypothetical protein
MSGRDSKVPGAALFQGAGAAAGPTAVGSLYLGLS